MFRRNHRRGAATGQYALIVGLIAVLALAGVMALGRNITAVLTSAGNRLSNVSGGVVSGGGADQAPTVPPAIQPPVAAPVALTAYMMVRNSYADADILANASDPQGLPLTVVSVQNASWGTAEMSAGVPTYMPSQIGAQSFTYTISNGTHTATGTANVLVSYAPNCKALLATMPTAETGVYTIEPPGHGQVQTRCDMTANGGGWTFVMRARGGSDAGWATTGALSTGSAVTVNNTFKFSDAVINAIRAGGIYRLVSDGTYSQVRYASGSCAYAHLTAVNGGACSNTYSGSGMTGGFASADAFSGHYGIADIQPNGTNGSIVSRHVDGSANHEWVVSGGTSICFSGAANCNFQIWVR